MAKLRHLAIAAQDPDATAQFYVEALGMSRLGVIKASWGFGHIVTDGVMSISILKYLVDDAAGRENGVSFSGLHHIGFAVDDVAAAGARVVAASGVIRNDISEALGMKADATVREYEGPDHVVFDLGGQAVWDVTREYR